MILGRFFISISTCKYMGITNYWLVLHDCIYIDSLRFIVDYWVRMSFNFLTISCTSVHVFPRDRLDFKETASWRSRHASRHVRDARAVMHVGIAYPRSRGKKVPGIPGTCDPQFCVSGKRPMREWQDCNTWLIISAVTWSSHVMEVIR